MTTYALTRKIRNVTHYLQPNLYWDEAVNVFSEAHFAAVVLPEAMQYRDRPQMVGELVDGSLDSAIWTELR